MSSPTMEMLKKKMKKNSGVNVDELETKTDVESFLTEVTESPSTEVQIAETPLVVIGVSVVTAEAVENMKKLEEIEAAYISSGAVIEGWGELGKVAKRKALVEHLKTTSGSGEGTLVTWVEPDFGLGVDVTASITPPKISSSDPIFKMVAAIEKIHALDEAITVATKLMEDVELNHFQLGGVLVRIHGEGWWQQKGHDSFRTFVEAEFGFGYIKATELMRIYKMLVELNVPWKKVEAIGWSKLRYLLPVVNKENIEEWINKAKDCSVLELVEIVKQSQISGDKVPDKVANFQSKSFRIHIDDVPTVNDAIEKAKAEQNSDNPSTAFVRVCLSYLSAEAGIQTPAGPPPLAGAMVYIRNKHEDVNAAVQEVLTVFKEVFPDVEIASE